MKNNIIIALLFAMCGLALVSCDSAEMKLHTTYDNPYVYIIDGEGNSREEILSMAEGLTSDYFIHLSSKAISEDIRVDFSITPGDGLQEGVDYQIMTPATNYVTFSVGLYERVIRVRWLPHVIDPTKDNTLKIRLTGSSSGNVTLGFPGTGQNNIEFVATKTTE